MRVTSDLWVSALVRRVFADGGFAAVERKGAHEAGAIFIVRRTRHGEYELFGPAAQTSYDERKPQDRRFSRLLVTCEEEVVKGRLEKELRFDPDVWIVELDTDAAVEDYLDIAAG